MHKPGIYVETSVWGYAFADDAPESRAMAGYYKPLHIISPLEVGDESD